ncbi:iron chelate uptake ABC transporter family permease subunit [Balneolales bacterium ANBcel1]|nr:iron chelate uptake ABC transporter family permease subunit [Balneolales bacterium ANBcel1]
MDLFFEFFSLRDPNIRYVLAGTILLGISAGALGCFAILRRRALVGDAVAHAVLPGVCLAFIVAGGKDPFLLIIGAFLFGLLSMVTMDFITRNSRIAPDASIGMVLSVFFGLGVVLLTYIQSAGFVDQSGLDDFLFGQAAAMIGTDVRVFGGLSLLILLLMVLAYKELQLISFDVPFARSIGYPVKRMEFLLAMLMVMTITAGIQAVGVVLMAAMLIIPAAAARYWTDSLRVMLVIAASVGAFSGITGSFISYTAPAMPTGPWMVVSAALIFFLSFLLAPGRGEIARHFQRRKFSFKIACENMLKTLYSLEEEDGRRDRVRTFRELRKKRHMRVGKLRSVLSSLLRRGFVSRYSGEPDGYVLTAAGRDEARRLVRVHRLWEQYLNKQLNIPVDHVHDDAESMEHLITADIETQLRLSLGSPDRDPHESRIPYSDSDNDSGGTDPPPGTSGGGKSEHPPHNS